MKTFSSLFRKYRLRAEFEKLSEFADALSNEGYHYEESIFSHWQKGTRIPTQRDVLLKLLKIFVTRKAINTLEEANEFLESTNQGFLTEKEISYLSLKKEFVFQVPDEVSAFTGREENIAFIKEESLDGKTLLIYGSAGVGKTTLAIKLGHLLQYNFPDGIFWYRLDTSKMEDILVSIAHLLEEKLPDTTDTQIIASFIRSILAKRKILLIFDNVEKESNIHFLLPHGASSSLIILSRKKDIYLPTTVSYISLESFSENEVLLLFENIFDKAYVIKYKITLLKLGEIVGKLPLAIHLLASRLKQSSETPEELLKKVELETLSLKNLSYENKNLYLALNLSYKNLSQKAQSVFLSLGTFEGKDFSMEAIAFMNGLTLEKTKTLFDELHNTSLIERSLDDKFRIHPMTKKFIAEKLTTPFMPIIIKITLFMFGGFTIFWIILQTQLLSFDFNRLFGACYFIVPLWGSWCGFIIAKRWGGSSSMMGRVFLFFSLGLFFQGFGQIIYTYYANVLNISTPYPSLGDVGYLGSMLCYIYGIYVFTKVSNVKYNLITIKQNLLPLIITTILLFSLYSSLLYGYKFDSNDLMKIFLDFIYPLGDGIYVLLAVLLYFELMTKRKNIMKLKVLFFVIALVGAFLSDFVFVYQANIGEWKVGQINDYMYLSSYLLMTLAILKLNSHLGKVIQK